MAKLSQLHLALISVSFFWGTSFAAAKTGLKELAPMNLVIFRFFMASILFGGILAFMKKDNIIERSDIPRFILLGFLAITSYFYIQFTGLQYTTTINAALIVAISPICTAIMSAILGWENFTLYRVIGIALAFAGVGLVITNGHFTVIFKSDTLIGDLLLLINAVVWAGFTLYGQSILKKYRPFVAMAYIHIFGTLLLVPLAFIATPAAPVPWIKEITAITWPTAAAALYLAAFCSVYGYYLWYTAVDRLGAVRTAVFSYLNPLFAIITGVLLLGEPLTAYIIIGGIMIIAGVSLANTGKHQTRPVLDEKS